MTDREKLAELLFQCNMFMPMGDIADHLLANGVIVPPCKVGDTVYMVQPIKKEIVAMNVVQIDIDRHGIWIRADDGIFHCVRPYKDYCFTREEAEAALKEEK